MKTIVILFISFVSFSSFAETCRFSDNSFDIFVKSEVERSKEKNTYKYSISNSKSSVGPVQRFFLRTSEKVEAPQSPDGWQVQTSESRRIPEGWQAQVSHDIPVRWSTSKEEIKPGEAVSGFSVMSNSRPGIVKVSLSGSPHIGKAIYTKIQRSKNTSCPGFWEQGSRGVEDPRSTTMTIGPIAKDQVSPTALFRLKPDQNWTGSIETSHDSLQAIDPLARGTIEVLVLGNFEVQPEDIQTNSIHFGRGEATPKSAKIVDAKTVLSKGSGQALLLTFDLEKVQVLCDLDRALFLTAKATKSRNVFTGVQIKPTFCDEKQWAVEVPGILKYRAMAPND